ncbi:hypothetical protein [Paenibacillus qinlingensis]|uniref:hypothetical protein n=1 Tax=Paenibacillus qinlingensis TaxID=1837343 RepID=UPI0015678BAB|nr:hypothetical protein [Paenibacillus qinlingensis]NQX62199.1 hypothetical protein [Paenibacillus qinlingensis]
MLTRSPLDHIIRSLENKNEWNSDENIYFNIYKPEYTITLEDYEDNRKLIPEFYSYAVSNPSTMYHLLSIKYHGTQLFGSQVVILDSGRYITPTPDWEFIHFGEYRVHSGYGLKYFIEDSPTYKLNEFLYYEDNSEASFARKRFFEVVLLFKDCLEKETFLEYVRIYKDDFFLKMEALEGEWSWIESSTQRQQE